MSEQRRWLEGERGASLLEVTTTTAILGLVLAIFFSVAVSLQTAVGREEGRVRRTDEARLALAQLDREIRSGNVLYDPATEKKTASTRPRMAVVRVTSRSEAPRSPSSLRRSSHTGGVPRARGEGAEVDVDVQVDDRLARHDHPVADVADDR